MNFAEKIAKENESQKKDKAMLEAYDKWEKPITPGDITNALIDFARENAREMPELLLMAMLVNTELLRALFPIDEFEKTYEEMKGEK